jgi:D-tyrosyl-tRNA(Tyr) deacylase
MRAVVQRVLQAHVDVEGETVGRVGHGLLAYVGLGRSDTAEDRAWMVAKIVGLRIFEEGSKMSRSVAEVGGGLLLVSQFTLYGDVRRGRRPSFDDAMPPEEAREAFEGLVAEARATGLYVATGRFRAAMQVHSINDGPVTIWLDSAERARARHG